MKILMTVPHRGIHTGGSVQLGQLSKEMARRGHDVTALFKRPDDPNAPLDPSLNAIIDAGVKVDRYHFRKLKYSDTLSEISRLRKFLKAEKFDVVHCFKGQDFDFVTLASIGVPIPALVVTRGNGMPLDFFNSFKYRRSKVTAIVAVCEELKRIVVETGHINPDKVAVIYSGVNLDRFDSAIDGAAVRRELGIPLDVKVVGIIGSVDFRAGKAKGGYEFAQAARQVLDHMPGTRFLCVGEISLDHFKPAREELNLGDSFVFSGFRTDVPRMLAAMDVSVCASIRGEGLMGTLRESLAMKVPVVSTDVGGNRELAREGRTGYLVPPGDPAAMAAGILKLLENDDARRKMGDAGRDLALDLCDYRKQADRLETLYRDAVNKNKAKANENS